MLFTSKISRNDIEIHFTFYNKHIGKEVTIKGEFQSKNVHEQFAIKFFTPGFPDRRMTSTVKVKYISRSAHTVILQDRTLKKWGLSNSAF